MGCIKNTFLDCYEVGKRGVKEVTYFLCTLNDVVEVINVEGDNLYQKKG